MSALAEVIQFPGKRHGKVLPFPAPPVVDAYTTPRDPALPAAVHALATSGRITRLTDSMIQRALVCPDGLVGAARVGAIISISYEYGAWEDPEAAHVVALVLREICPAFDPVLLRQVFVLAARAQTRHEAGQRDAETAVVIAHMRVIASQLAGASLDDDPDGAA